MEYLIFVLIFFLTVYIFPFAATRWVRELDRLLKTIKEIEPDKSKVVEALTPAEERMNKDLETTAKKVEEEIPSAAWVGSPEPSEEAKQIEAEAMKREREAREKLGPTPTVVEGGGE